MGDEERHEKPSIMVGEHADPIDESVVSAILTRK